MCVGLVEFFSGGLQEKWEMQKHATISARLRQNSATAFQMRKVAVGEYTVSFLHLVEFFFFLNRLDYGFSFHIDSD